VRNLRFYRPLRCRGAYNPCGTPTGQFGHHLFYVSYTFYLRVVKLSPSLVLQLQVAVRMGHFASRLLLRFPFKSEEGGSMYLRIFGKLIPDYMVLYFRR
jgi:hypothetical protein